MNIQTISIVVPTKGCVNNCPFCVSCMHDSPYEKSWDEDQMIKRIRYAIMNNITTCIITGTGEPLQNMGFINKLSFLFHKLDNPFPNIELQTTGVFLTQTDKCFDNFSYTKDDKPIYKYIDAITKLGVNTISLSVADIFDDDINNEIIGIPKKLDFKLRELISLLKERGFNIRLSLNMIKHYDRYDPEDIIKKCKDLGANQITFRTLYCPKINFTAQGKWVKENSANPIVVKKIKEFIQGTPINGHMDGNGQLLYQLPFGPFVYSIMGMSTVIDDDCMGKSNSISLKFIVLRENGKLYSRWDDEGSLIF